ncbi:MAG: phage terminase small subunit P27 family [Proteobacteria bacterium]|nr:MAG: phage terminase small subunit P27 family [Pseudomonadota bacterium]
MTRGRRPEPSAVKKAKGNPGRRRIVDAAPSSGIDAAALTAPPAWLDTSAAVDSAAARETSALAQKIWNELLPDLQRMQLVQATDKNALARYCRYAAEWVYYTRTIDREGAYYTTSSEHVAEIRRPHPAMRFRKDCEQALKELGETMGLNPAARQRLFQQLAAMGKQPALPGVGDDAAAPSPAPSSDAAAPVGFLSRLH